MQKSRTGGERIAEEIGQALAGDAWHGPSLSELLKDVTAEDAAHRPIPSAHNIWELVLHITSWANITRRRLTGGKVEPEQGEDWPVPEAVSEKNWESALAALAESHERLCEVVAGLSDEELDARVPKGKRSVSNMLHGVTQHDAYHGGQIALLKKALKSTHKNHS
ncbi:MAG: DinB family protein [Gemmatimonadaceae bacterium]